MSRGLWGAACLVVSIPVFSASTSVAEVIPTVTLTRTGPDREIPFGKALYLAGTATEETHRLQPIIVRTGSNRLWSDRAPSCSDLSRTLGALKAGPTPATGKLPPAFEPDETSTAALWTNGGRDRALVVAPWERAKADSAEAPFKILVASNADFFRSGFSYCLLLVESKVERKDAAPKVLELLASYEAAIAECRWKERQPDADSDAAAEQPRALRTEPERAACETAAVEAFDGHLAALTELPEAALTKILELVPTAEQLTRAPRALRFLLRRWQDELTPVADVPVPAFPRAELAHFIDVNTALGGAAASLLARKDGVLAQVDKQTARLEYFTIARPPVQIHHLGLRDDGGIVLSVDGKKGASFKAPAKADELMIPNTAASLRDLVELTQGRIKLATYEPVRAILARLEPLLDAPLKATDEQVKKQVEELTALRDQVDALAIAMRRGFAASATTPSPATSLPLGASLVEHGLGTWLRTVVPKCDPSEMTRWATAGVVPPPRCGVNPKAWPGYAKVDDTPLDEIVTTASEVLEARAAWTAAAGTLASIRTSQVATMAPMETKLAFTQATWLGSYVTPVVGYAHLPGLDDTLLYAAVQVHLFPNEVNEPQWAHGLRDFERFFALELGVAPNAGSFGPDKRYDGISALPPIFIGLSTHPLPYTSVTAGWALTDARTTTLPQQQRDAHAEFYVGFSVQANIPDLIYSRFGAGMKTTMEK